MLRSLITAAVLSTVALAACAGEPARSLRVMVKLAQPAVDADAIARRAAAVAGVPVVYVAAVSEAWHALALSCRAGPECESALSRLRADTGTYESVQIDGHKRPM